MIFIESFFFMLALVGYCIKIAKTLKIVPIRLIQTLIWKVAVIEDVSLPLKERTSFLFRLRKRAFDREKHKS